MKLNLLQPLQGDSKIMIQYEMYFTNEYIEEIVYELADIMKIDVEKKEMMAAMQERDRNSLNNIYILKKDDNIICIDCNDKDWIYPLVVKCQEADADVVKATMLKWDNLIRKEYGQELTVDIDNVYGKPDTLLNSIEKYYGKQI